MISITPFQPGTPGRPLCVTVTGCASVPSGEAAIGGIVLTGRVTGANGTYTICFDLPAETTGPIVVTAWANGQKTKKVGKVG